MILDGHAVEAADGYFEGWQVEGREIECGSGWVYGAGSRRRQEYPILSTNTKFAWESNGQARDSELFPPSTNQVKSHDGVSTRLPK